jgi:hypothetical protein
LLEDESCSAFDPDCVSALRAILPLERPERTAAAQVPEREPATPRGLPTPAYGHAGT